MTKSAMTSSMHADDLTSLASSLQDEHDEIVTSTDTTESEEYLKENAADSLATNLCNSSVSNNTEDKGLCASSCLSGENISNINIFGYTENDQVVHHVNSENLTHSDSTNKTQQNSVELSQSLLEKSDKSDSSSEQGQLQQENAAHQQQLAADDEQHNLSGPIRRRREARQQRQEAANPATASTRITIPPAVAAQWREIGFQWGLENDNDIAKVLLQHYEDVQAGRPPRPPPPPRCRGCGERMRPAPCTQCGPNKHHLRFDKDEHKGGGSSQGGFGDGAFSGGRSGFCGRCRD